MDDFSKNLIISAFFRYRRSGGNVGIGELLAGLQMVETKNLLTRWEKDVTTETRRHGERTGEKRSIDSSDKLPLHQRLLKWVKNIFTKEPRTFVSGPDIHDSFDNLHTHLSLLWCHTPAERHLFAEAWQAAVQTVIAQAQQDAAAERGTPERSSYDSLSPEQPAPVRSHSEPPSPEPMLESSSEYQWEVLPTQAPPTPLLPEEPLELTTDLPVTRRQMLYAWRYLHRPVADGTLDVLDIAATIDRTARYGFFPGPIYRRRERNHAHLLLLIDQDGSMVPFHRFTRDVVETAYQSNTLQQVRVCYFHNIPKEYVYHDSYLTCPVALAEELATCDAETSIVLVSDAGAARGYRQLERIRATAACLRQLRRTTPLIAWLNPMPTERWVGASAEMIANQVPMFPMNPDGFSSAIVVVKG